ncbi:MAG: hemolysin III family protein [Gammaproteobacteria bacterium]|nr:hemolysin III family protein [Gammaproteobacteria bacterium]NNF48269.1 hemolysin III family protein [Woeseiaceae bacterium]MBT8093882.1 hemolysin III family protein [Gammaproteobacteria bacterium]MBT8104452.1 hemolysin III family protein [Gammaproteobacteria bacterium]NNK24468.1 hemolysin III family protein [Woeseiaceae bacterium]
MYPGERFNSISHLVGASLALVGGGVLVTISAFDGDAAKIASYSVYAVTLFTLYLASTLYHSFPGRAKLFFRVVDHQAIYLLIAGTYTPIAVVVLKSVGGWWLLGGVWALAMFGMVLDAVRRTGPRIGSLILYVAMGWLCVLAVDSLLVLLPRESFVLLFAGGIFYTTGIVFYILDSWYPWCHGVWHLFVLAGSISHYFAILFL